MGERNYLKLSSSQGACYYPAGHIWHYIPVVLLHLHSDYAVEIMKLMHALMHQLTLVIVVKICYIFFGQEDEKEDDGVDYQYSFRGQFIAIAFMANARERLFFSEMYNDQIMLLYLVMSIYSFAMNKPV